MRPIKSHLRRRPAWRIALLALVAVLIGGGGSVFSLAAFKVIDFSKLFGRSRPAHPANWVAVPLSARPIPAYTAVTREYLLNPKTGELEVKWYPPEEARRLSELDITKVLGRVTAREKPAMYYFHESDFLPPGTSPGVAGGTPPGKRAITLDASQLKGCVFDLKEGDHIDLQASIPGGHAWHGRGQFQPAGQRRAGDTGRAVAAQTRSRQTLGSGRGRGLAGDYPARADHVQFRYERRNHERNACARDRARRARPTRSPRWKRRWT